MPHRRKSNRKPDLIEVISQLLREWRMLRPSERRDLTTLFIVLVALPIFSIAL